MEGFGRKQQLTDLIPFEPDFTFKVVNFKSIASVQLPVARLTVLAGSNSSGKSSLLQAALFLAQSIKAKACVINGDLVRLGEPKDVIRDGADELTLEVSFKQPAAGDEDQKHVQFGVALRADAEALIVHGMQLRLDHELKLSARDVVCPEDLKPLLMERELPLSLVEPEQFNLPPDSYLTAVGLEPGRLIYRTSEAELRNTFEDLVKSPIGSYMLNDLAVVEIKAGRSIPTDVLEKIQAGLRGGGRRGKVKLDNAELEVLFPYYMDRVAPGGWASDGISLPPLGGPNAYRQATLSFEREQGGPIAPAIAQITQAGKRMQAFAASVVYLGPLRDDPRVAYPLGHTISNLPVGEKGEFTAAYLESNRGRIVAYRDQDGHLMREELLAAASRWSRYLGIADEVGVSSRGKLGHQLSLTLDGHDRDPTAIGVGASQLLPVVVTVLGASRGQLVLLEQPELHLHPRVQSRLADFFCWARPDIRLLIETHSEYLIARLRLRIAQGKVNPRNVAALFVAIHRPIDDPVAPSAPREPFSEFKELKVDELGDFSHWPEGFFDSLDEDMVMLAKAVTERLSERDETGSGSAS